MSVLIPILVAGGVISAIAFGSKSKAADTGMGPEETFDDTSLFTPQAPAADQSTAPPTSTPSSDASSSSSSGSSSSSSSSSSSTTSKTASNTASGTYKNFPLVLFSQSKAGNFDPGSFIKKFVAAIQSKNLNDLKVMYTQFMGLNNDQVRFFHNRFYSTYKKTVYNHLKTVNLGNVQYLVGNILGKLNTAGVGSTPKEKI